MELIKREARRDYDKGEIRILINKMSFGVTIELFRHARCYIGPDTGGSHLAYWLHATITILHRDPKMEAYHRLGDFFPYSENVRNTPYKCVWATLDEFHLRNGARSVRNQVLVAFKRLMRETDTLTGNDFSRASLKRATVASIGDECAGSLERG